MSSDSYTGFTGQAQQQRELTLKELAEQSLNLVNEAFDRANSVWVHLYGSSPREDQVKPAKAEDLRLLLLSTNQRLRSLLDTMDSILGGLA